MALRRRLHSALLLILAPCLLDAQALPARSLRVAAVQLMVGGADVASFEAFREHMRSAARQAVAAGAELVVYPEYTGALVALVPYAWAVAESPSAAGALALVAAREPWIGSVRDVFLEASGFAERAMREVFGEIAAAYGVHVVAGTYFARVTDASGRPSLANRAMLFWPDGGLRYEQDKVHLTEFEDALDMLAGSADAARPFAVGAFQVGLTICRDTFFEEWERRFADVDLWIDIKGNGELYTPEVEERFGRALPARLESSGVPAGLTVCLTGRLLDFVWEGPSSLERLDEAGRPASILRASSVRGEEILVADIGLP